MIVRKAQVKRKKTRGKTKIRKGDKSNEIMRTSKRKTMETRKSRKKRKGYTKRAHTAKGGNTGKSAEGIESSEKNTKVAHTKNGKGARMKSEKLRVVAKLGLPLVAKI